MDQWIDLLTFIFERLINNSFLCFLS